jgi:hypothetical protein
LAIKRNRAPAELLGADGPRVTIGPAIGARHAQLRGRLPRGRMCQSEEL